jgi:hypothetical protein
MQKIKWIFKILKHGSKVKISKCKNKMDFPINENMFPR